MSDPGSDDQEASERVLEVLRPFAANWSGSLKRGDLVIPSADIERVVDQIVAVIAELTQTPETDAQTLFQVLAELRKLASVQDQAQALRKRFRISPRSKPIP